MNKDIVRKIADLRILVGFLGEKSQQAWWSSSFLTPSAKAYLTPLFPRTLLQAQHHGVTAAATLVHDEFIGIGANYHLFRMPEAIELELDRFFREKHSDHYITALSSEQSALDSLQAIAGSVQSEYEGALLVGDYQMEGIDNLVQKIAAAYLPAFQNHVQCYPFMRDAV